MPETLTHTVEEARLLTRVARETGVVTQMGNQGHAQSDSRRLVECLKGGILGGQASPRLDRSPHLAAGSRRPSETQSIPITLDWDLWIGPAPMRPYHGSYAPFNWRGWWDFGTGALGDMGCHNMDLAFFALDLKNPTRIEGSGEGGTDPVSSQGVHRQVVLSWQ